MFLIPDSGSKKRVEYVFCPLLRGPFPGVRACYPWRMGMWTAGEAIANMNAAQHASMLRGMMPNGGQADQWAGGIMSRGMAVGSPLMSGVGGMLGLDPLSIGMKMGGMAYSSGAVGLAGAAGIGMAGAGIAGIAGIGASYAGGQMQMGAQQQMQLNQGLRQNYNHMNGQGGQGFTSNQGFQIGGQIRSMADQQGSGGEHYGFGELSRIAQNMGRMGMAQNVRTVEEFRSKFKETLETIKKVSHELGGTLEDAMKTIQSMKGSGVFKAAEQVGMSQNMRVGAMAGGMATSEMAGMASIGSQISRAVGGLGRSGAGGGIRTLSQIGSATAVGALSEEDIYNATGQTGAEGRQALATSQMQQSARFMQSSKGRYFLASIAGKDGKLNDDSVAEWMSGGAMSTGRTAEMAHQNLGGIGRANFIRNEGRLRGEALNKFGGLAQSMAMQQWLTSRGHDPNNMDDRSMLAFQRFTGQGRDEADASIKQISHMPEILANMQQTERGLGVADAQQRQRNTEGIAGFKRKLEGTKEHVNGKLQQAGARVLKAGSNELESWFNGMMDVYAETMTEGMDQAVRQMETSTDKGQAMKSFKRSFGEGGRSRGPISPAERSNASAGASLRAANAGFGGSKSLDLGKANSDMIKRASIGATFDPNDPNGAHNALMDFEKGLSGDVLKQYKAIAKEEDRIGFAQNLQMGAGVNSDATMAATLSRRKTQYGGATSGHRSEADALSAQAASLFGRRERTDAVRQQELGGLGKALSFGMAMAGMQSTKGHTNAEAITRLSGGASRFYDRLSGQAEHDEGAAGVLNDTKTQGMVADLYMGSDSEKKTARSRMYDEVQKLQTGADGKGGKMSQHDKGRVEVLSAMAMASDPEFKQLMEDQNAGKGTKEGQAKVADAMRRITRNPKLSDEEISRLTHAGVEGGKDALMMKQREQFEQYRQKLVAQTTEDKNRLQGTGVAVRDKDGRMQVVGVGKERSAATDAIGQEMSGLLNMDKSDYKGVAAYEEKLVGMNERIAGSSQKDKELMARKFVGTAAGDAAARSLSSERRFAGAMKRFGGAGGAAEAMFGFDVDAKEAGMLKKMGSEEQSQYLAQKMGLSGEESKKLSSALGEKNEGLRASRLEELKAGLKGKAAEQLKEREEGKRDPNVVQLEKIRANSDEQTKLMKALVMSSEGARRELEEANKKDAEAKS